jgi:hypothetical protein
VQWPWNFLFAQAACLLDKPSLYAAINRADQFAYLCVIYKVSMKNEQTLCASICLVFKNVDGLLDLRKKVVHVEPPLALLSCFEDDARLAIEEGLHAFYMGHVTLISGHVCFKKRVKFF